ncbi:MAG: hypothetical protein HY901_08060 [Deltaproteobacteria bacterium]|nr:hypothetical protein [Deltaproteobacteria bacterium]
MTRALALLMVLACATPAYAAERWVSLQPLGEMDPALVDAASAAISARFAVRVRREPARALPPEAWNPSRKRWRAEKILEAIAREHYEPAWKTVAITAAEIGTTRGEVPDRRVDGLAEVGGAICVISTWSDERLSETSEVLHSRVERLVVHELGHVLGLAHCPSPGCVMRDGRSRVPPAQGSDFCDRCRRAAGPLLREQASGSRPQAPGQAVPGVRSPEADAGSPKPAGHL